jgi:hypothetical protein
MDIMIIGVLRHAGIHVIMDGKLSEEIVIIDAQLAMEIVGKPNAKVVEMDIENGYKEELLMLGKVSILAEIIVQKLLIP